MAAFRYELEAVQLKSQWNLDESVKELSRWRVLVDKASEELDGLNALRMEAFEELRRTMNETGSVRASRWQVQSAYIRDLEVGIRKARESLSGMITHKESAEARVLAAHTFNDGIAMHRRECRESHARDMHARELNLADELWMLRRGRREGAL